MNKRSSKPTQPGNRKGKIVRLAAKPQPPMDVAALWQAEGLDLEGVTQELAHLPELNATRVVKLHQRLSAGEYVLHSQRVARKLLEFESELTR